jgi:ABC-2 type transport system permease protein
MTATTTTSEEERPGDEDGDKGRRGGSDGKPRTSGVAETRRRRSVSSQLAAAILVNAVYEMKNYPIVLVTTVLSPLSFLIVITFVSKGTLLGAAIEGGLIMSMFQSGTSLQGDLSHLKNDFKLQDMVVGSPTTAGIYVAGMTASELIYSSPAVAILAVLFYLYIHVQPIQVLLIVAVLVLMFVASVSIGFLLATISSDIVQSFAFSRLLSTLFSTIPPVYYPITYIPLPYRYLAYLSPTTYASEIAQNSAGLIHLDFASLAAAWGILITVSVVFLAISITKSRWRDR